MHGPEVPKRLQVTPLLSELREGNMVNNLEDLTRSASEAAADIHRLQDEVRRGPASYVPCCDAHYYHRAAIHSSGP